MIVNEGKLCHGIFEILSLLITGQLFLTGRRLRNFRVGVTNNNPRRVRPNINNYHLCSHHRGAAGRGQLLNLNCRRRLYGRYVIVQIHGRQYLTLCEVQVFGEYHIVANNKVDMKSKHSVSL